MTETRKPHLPSYEQDLVQLRALLQAMGERSEEMLAASLDALARRDPAAARRLVTMDSALDTLEMTIDSRCLKLLARWQPVASDLRFIATALKAVTDLERIGDQSVSLCERLLVFLDVGAELRLSARLLELGHVAQAQVHDALRALQEEDAARAEQVISWSAKADLLARQLARTSFTTTPPEPGRLEEAMTTQEIASRLQRIAAHGTNIAELVIFLVRGEDVRHPENRVAASGGSHEN